MPVHVFPVGDEIVGGDVAVVSMVAPDSGPEAFQGFRPGLRSVLRLQGQTLRAEDRGRRPRRQAGGGAGAYAGRPPGRPPSYPLAFESGDQDRRIEARIDPQPGEVSVANNAFGADLAIDHTKIRVLYLEGANENFVAQAGYSWRRRGTRGLSHLFRGADGRHRCRVHGPRAGRRRGRLFRGLARRGSPKTPRNCSPTTRSS